MAARGWAGRVSADLVRAVPAVDGRSTERDRQPSGLGPDLVVHALWPRRRRRHVHLRRNRPTDSDPPGFKPGPWPGWPSLRPYRTTVHHRWTGRVLRGGVRAPLSLSLFHGVLEADEGLEQPRARHRAMPGSGAGPSKPNPRGRPAGSEMDSGRGPGPLAESRAALESASNCGAFRVLVQVCTARTRRRRAGSSPAAPGTHSPRSAPRRRPAGREGGAQLPRRALRCQA